MSQVTCRAGIKRFVLAKCKAIRPAWGCKRVSSEYLDWCEAKVRAIIVADVRSHPSRGVTFRP